MNLQKKKNNFLIFLARQGLILAPTYLHSQWRIRVGLRSFLESFNNCWFDLFYFFIILKTFLCFLVFLIIWKLVSRDARNQTDT